MPAATGVVLVVAEASAVTRGVTRRLRLGVGVRVGKSPGAALAVGVCVDVGPGDSQATSVGDAAGGMGPDAPDLAL